VDCRDRCPGRGDPLRLKRERAAPIFGSMTTQQADCETALARLERKIAEAKITIIVAVLGIVGLATALLKFG